MGWSALLQDEYIKAVNDIALADSTPVYLVGGHLRDFVMQTDTKFSAKQNIGPAYLDYDFAVKSERQNGAAEFARLVSEKLNGVFVLLDEKNDTARVVLNTDTDNPVNIDFALCVGGGIESDVMRRDYSVNALAWDPKNPDVLIDKVHAMQDIENRTIRALSEENLKDDPLRILRAYRFSAALSFSIDQTTKNWLAQNASLLSGVAGERISTELFALFSHANTFVHLQAMADNKVLDAVFPELAATRVVTANAYHHLGLLDHSLEAVRQMELFYERASERLKESCNQIIGHKLNRLAVTKVATLLHDIGKPETWEITPEGRHTFYAHDSLGAKMSDETALRLKWSKSVSRFINRLIKWHLRPGALFHSGEPTQKAINRFYRQVGVDVPELILLAYGDLGATRGQGLGDEARARLETRFDDLLSGYFLYIEEQARTPRFLTGADVMELLQIAPGPVVGELLEALDEAQTLKIINSKKEAERFAKELFLKQSQ